MPWEFAKFNLLQDGSALYGSHPWHWNFTQGVPTVTMTFLPLALLGMKISPKRCSYALLQHLACGDAQEVS